MDVPIKMTGIHPDTGKAGYGIASAYPYSSPWKKLLTGTRLSGKKRLWIGHYIL
jgi:hypothetical protein